MPIPSDIASYLTPDEEIVIVGSGQCETYVTNKRLILKRRHFFGGKEIVEVSYRHISSIEYEKKISIGLIVAGICILILAFLIYLLRPSILWSWIGYQSTWTVLPIVVGIVGAILIILGVARAGSEPPLLTIHVVGRKPIALRGTKLEELFKVIRQYREETTTTEKKSS